MTVTGPRSPTIASSIPGGGAQPWFNINNTFSSDNLYTNITGDSSTLPDTLVCSGFGFNIPGTNLVSGILVKCEFHQDNASDVTDGEGVRLTLGTSSFGFPIASGAIPPNIDTIVPYGVLPIDNVSSWNITLPIDGFQINIPTFGVKFSPNFTSSVGVDQVFVDHVTMTITHYPSGLEPKGRTPIGDSTIFDSSIFNSNIF